MLLHRQLLTSKQLHCWLGGNSAVGILLCPCMCCHELRGTNSLQESVAVANFMKMGDKFTDNGTCLILHSLSAPILFFSPKDALYCWQE